METFSAYGVLDSVNYIDENDSVYRYAVSKSNCGSGSIQKCVWKSQKSLFVSKQRFEEFISAVDTRMNENRRNSIYASECD